LFIYAVLFKAKLGVLLLGGGIVAYGILAYRINVYLVITCVFGYILLAW